MKFALLKQFSHNFHWFTAFNWCYDTTWGPTKTSMEWKILCQRRVTAAKNHTIGLGKIWCDFQHFGKWMSLVNKLWLLLPKSFNTDTVTVFENHSKTDFIATKTIFTVLKTVFTVHSQSRVHSVEYLASKFKWDI